MKKHRFVTLILPVITLILELLPYGVTLNFGHQLEDGTIGYTYRSYSYFSLMPFGYGNFAPLLTAIMTCILLLLLLLYCITGKERLAVTARNLLCVGTVVSLGPLLYGLRFYSLVGALISLTMAAELLLLYRGFKK